MELIRTINFKEVDIEVVFDFQPAEARTHDHPGSYPEIDITDIKHCDESIYDIAYSHLDEIEANLFELLEDDEQY